MRAAQFHEYGGPEVLQIVDLPDPHPGPGQVRIVVHAAGIGASDIKMRAGTLSFGATLPQTTGSDVAGVVDELGHGVTDVAVGARVFGVADGNAAVAELALLSFRAPIPDDLGFVDAAALPAAIETATRTLDQLGVSERTTLFVNGASGGVGTAVVQLAVARGARVIGAAGPANQELVRGYGAEPVTYGDGMVERVRAVAPDGVDAALDVAGNGVLPELIDLAGGADHVITVADVAGAQEHGVRFSNGYTDGPAYHAMADIGRLVAAGQFWLPVDRTFPLDRIADAHRRSEQGHVRGRLVVVVR